MKINPLQQSEAISKYSNVVSARSKGIERPGISDSLELSDGAQKFASLLKEAKEAMEKSSQDEEIRASDIINQIKDNSYDISAEEVADKILGGIPKNI